MSDCAVIGGGAVGLSIAYELARSGCKAVVIDRGRCGQEASWAGGGILPASVFNEQDTPYEKLAGLSAELHQRWAEDLNSETGIDTGYHRCGEILFKHEEISGDPLSRDLPSVASRGIHAERLDATALRNREPNIALDEGDRDDLLIYHTPDSAQIRNPRHLQALKAACLKMGVSIVEQAAVDAFDVQGEQVVSVHTTAGRFSADRFCLTAGAWTSQLTNQLGFSLPIKPIRGQMALLQTENQLLRSVVHQGGHYLIPRLDGRMLVGSTLEDVGFEKKTTDSAIAQLLRFAERRVPLLRNAKLEKCWAGFRPASPDGYPFLGALPGFSNAWVAAGHFRWGLFLSPGTAVLIKQLMLGEDLLLPLNDFRLTRCGDLIAKSVQ